MTRAMALDDHVTSPDSIEYPSDLVSLDVGRSMKQTKPARPPSLHKKPVDEPIRWSAASISMRDSTSWIRLATSGEKRTRCGPECLAP